MQSSASDGIPSQYISCTAIRAMRYKARKKRRATEIFKLNCDSAAAEKADMASLVQEKAGASSELGAPQQAREIEQGFELHGEKREGKR